MTLITRTRLDRHPSSLVLACHGQVRSSASIFIEPATLPILHVQRSEWTVTPLHLCKHRRVRFHVVKYLIEEGQADPSCQDENGSTPLHLAAREGPIPGSQVPNTREAV